jgi:hypothetical protein
VVFGKQARKTPPGQAPWRYAGEALPVSPCFKYLGITLHCTRGMSAAVERLRAAGQRAIWAMHGCCTQHGLTDFASRTRMFRVLAAPILTYGAEVWGGPSDAMGSLNAALHAPLQVPQNDYLRHLGGLRRSVPAHVLCAESCLPPLARAWVRAGSRQWNRMLTAKPTRRPA